MTNWQQGHVTGPDKAVGARPEVGGRGAKGRAGSLSLRGSRRTGHAAKGTNGSWLRQLRTFLGFCGSLEAVYFQYLGM